MVMLLHCQESIDNKKSGLLTFFLSIADNSACCHIQDIVQAQLLCSMELSTVEIPAPLRFLA